jgi:ABC-type transporter MlaC component
MKRILSIIAFVIFAAVAVNAQEEQQEKAAPVRLTSEQQQQVSKAAASVDKAKLEADAAVARYETAQARLTALLYQIMAKLKLSPEEYKPVVNQQGELIFEKITPPKL